MFFSQISTVSPLANALAIPVMGWISTPLALLAAVFAALLPSLANLFMQALWAVQQGVDAALNALLLIPYASAYVPQAPALWAAFGLLCGAGMVLGRRFWRLAGLLGVLGYIAGAYAWAAHNASRPDAGWRAVFLDVGQGMAVLLQSQGRSLLFDTGPRYSVDSDGAARIILPYLQATGVRSLDHAIVSHADDDHTGGVRSLLARMPVAQWWGSLPDVHPVRALLPASFKPCAQGQGFDWAGLRLEWLHPAQPAAYASAKSNTVSCVLRVSDGAHSVLLTGDIEAAQEAALVGLYGTKLKSTVLLAPHHGSKTSSTAAFLSAVQPELTVMQNGYRNRFGHPHPTVSERYASMGLAVARSDWDGALIADFKGQSKTFTRWREAGQRYWHTPVSRSERTKSLPETGLTSDTAAPF